jgi:protein-L-isoaspartate(D-aspartate) O-methyltransferase
MFDSPFANTPGGEAGDPFAGFPGDHRVALRNLVEGQLRPMGVRDPRLLQAMGSLPRTLFVPQTVLSSAFRDRALSVAPGRWMLDPATLARLVEALEIEAEDSVLDVASATGYSAALLASLARRVYALEGDAHLAEKLRLNVARLQMQNVALVGEDEEAAGWAFLGTCRAVLINGAVELLPPALTEALPEGARLAALVAREDGAEPDGVFPLCEARLYLKGPAGVAYRVLFEAQAPRLTAFDRKRGFVF